MKKTMLQFFKNNNEFKVKFTSYNFEDNFRLKELQCAQFLCPNKSLGLFVYMHPLEEIHLVLVLESINVIYSRAFIELVFIHIKNIRDITELNMKNIKMTQSFVIPKKHIF